jgi:hypothetical protein
VVAVTSCYSSLVSPTLKLGIVSEVTVVVSDLPARAVIHVRNVGVRMLRAFLIMLHVWWLGAGGASGPVGHGYTSAR